MFHQIDYLGMVCRHHENVDLLARTPPRQTPIPPGGDHSTQAGAIKVWHRLLGELCRMSLEIPGSRGCFSFFQEALNPGAQRINITTPVRNQLHDFLWIACDFSYRPTNLAEVAPTPPTYYGYVDAVSAGMGGVWFPPGRRIQWRCTNPPPTVSIFQFYGGPFSFRHTSKSCFSC